MSEYINTINLIGRIGNTIELKDIKYFESGKVLVKLSLAVKRNDSSKEPDWFQLEFWNKTAEIAAQYATKGTLIGISGEIKIEEWFDSNNQKPRIKPVVKVRTFELLGSPRQQNNDSATEDYDI